MRNSNTRVYFAFKGDDFDPNEITKEIGVNPSESWRKGEKGKYNPKLDYSCWKIETERGKEKIFIDNLITEIIEKLKDKGEKINKIKREKNLTSVLQIVLEIETNGESSTPALGHDLKTIEFLYKTETITDVDIYLV